MCTLYYFTQVYVKYKIFEMAKQIVLTFIEHIMFHRAPVSLKKKKFKKDRELETTIHYNI